MTRVVDAWDEGYRAGVHDATHPASSPTINPYQRSDVDADHVIAEAARAWHRSVRASDATGADTAGQQLVAALDAEAAWLSRSGCWPSSSCATAPTPSPSALSDPPATR